MKSSGPCSRKAYNIILIRWCLSRKSKGDRQDCFSPFVATMPQQYCPPPQNKNESKSRRKWSAFFITINIIRVVLLCTSGLMAWPTSVDSMKSLTTKTLYASLPLTSSYPSLMLRSFSFHSSSDLFSLPIFPFSFSATLFSISMYGVVVWLLLCVPSCCMHIILIKSTYTSGNCISGGEMCQAPQWDLSADAGATEGPQRWPGTFTIRGGLHRRQTGEHRCSAQIWHARHPLQRSPPPHRSSQDSPRGSPRIDGLNINWLIFTNPFFFFFWSRRWVREWATKINQHAHMDCSNVYNQ